MSLLAQVQSAALDWENRLNHAGQGESAQVVLMKRHATTNQLIDFLPVEAFGYRDVDAAGDRLPPGVAFELHIAADLLTEAQVKEVAGVKHGKQVFQFVAGGDNDAGIIFPTGHRRFWRFWLAHLERLP